MRCSRPHPFPYSFRGVRGATGCAQAGAYNMASPTLILSMIVNAIIVFLDAVI